jgi:methylated-DNA-[protein]-cysteine S-methyltransferase
MHYASRVARFHTRTGNCSLRLTAGPAGLELLELNPVGQARSPVREDHPVVRETLRQLAAYFAGELKEFDLPLDPKGTEFQRAVWDRLLQIPYGETRTYSDIARAIGKPLAVRAVGAANGSNPIAIIVPCHRVIGKSGKLVGFGGGLPMKRMLLDLETEHAHLFGQAATR